MQTVPVYNKTLNRNTCCTGSVRLYNEWKITNHHPKIKFLTLNVY